MPLAALNKTALTLVLPCCIGIENSICIAVALLSAGLVT